MNKLMTSPVLYLWICCLSVIGFTGCGSYAPDQDKMEDTPERGIINVSADESFKPLVDAFVQVYESNHQDTRIRVTYKPEAECLKDMLVDSVRMIIATRTYSAAEKQLVADSLKVSMSYRIIARDAVAVIVNPERKDSFFTTTDLRQMLQGKFKENLIPVFDGLKATSTVRFIIDSLLHGDSLSSKVTAARSSEEVIEYISTRKDAVGFIGVSWIGNKDDEQQVRFLEKVKLVPLESRFDPEFFVIPVQSNIYNWRYPLVRDLVYILKERHRGLGHGFADFMTGEKGQLICKRAYLSPAQIDLTIRKAKLNQD